MSIKALIAATAFAGILAVSVAETASAATIFVDLGASSQDFTLYGLGPVSPGVGSFTVGQGSSVYDAGTNTSTFTLSGTITGGSTGYDSGTYSFVTTYTGLDTPQGGPNSPIAQSNPADTNEFFYDFLDPSTTMTLNLFGTPTGDHSIALVAGGNFVADTGFSFAYVSTDCTGVSSCGQNNVGLTPGATIFGPVDVFASFSTVPEPSTWALMLLGFAGIGFVGYRRARVPRAA